ncbi:anthranilate synthase component 1 [Pseudarcicella hirudinis]|uniref:Anthranilate synthase component 1 n=1 Tax=Pseudarcicella hirudinis TaxID=1079859 RepID=A0A1I5Q849_9BACT|nr:anthranilate synthase component I family protein [Pseudarcicella hirudinis]SFP42056.1 anthranilate synthase component 1 [Pseudarcicella hirudinis]
MNFTVTTSQKKRLADTITPVGIFLKLRDKFKNTVILESADYHGKEHGYSHIACDPVASFVLDNDIVTQKFPDGTTEQFPLQNRKDGVKALMNFAKRFEWNRQTDYAPMANGMFGHISYDSVEYFEDIEIQAKNDETSIPQIIYYVYRYVIAINHFKDELFLYEHQYSGEQTNPEKSVKGLEFLEMLLNMPHYATKSFKVSGEEKTNFTDEEMREIIQECIKHCLRGDVFQIVPSRRFSKTFEGDDFQVYRALRSINPSPYMFYFDYENYRIFGASPEKQIGIKNGIAEIHPIAGTFRRTGDDEKDAELARDLLADPKESAEHVMLVDLARNDLSRSSDKVQVETFKEVQFYSHVIHLVSKVTGKMTKDTNPLQLVADTFPAGTLSGSPKHNAMSIINRLEKTNRHIYGGAIGYMDFLGNFNHAIAIRTFLSKNNTLFYQAGMGVVAKSVIETEMQEINLKLGALRKALELAEEI